MELFDEIKKIREINNVEVKDLQTVKDNQINRLQSSKIKELE